MGNRSINSLDPLEELKENDLFVVWDSGQNVPVKMSGEQMAGMLPSIAIGRGGISEITWTESGTSGDGKIHTGTIHYAIDETTDTFQIRDGFKGDTGPQTYVHILYSNKEPTSDADMGDVPDSWIGIYVGTEISDPDELHYTDLTWYEWQGPQGYGASYTVASPKVGNSTLYTMYTSANTVCGSFTVYDGQGTVSSVDMIGVNGTQGNVPLTLSTVSDLTIGGNPLVVGSAVLSDAYTALLGGQRLVCPVTDIAQAQRPYVNSAYVSNGTIEMYKPASITAGWVTYHSADGKHVCHNIFSNGAPTSHWDRETIAVTPASGYSFDEVYCERAGDVASLYVLTGSFSWSNAWVTVASVPTDAYPSTPCYVLGTSGTNIASIQVTTNGEVQMRTSSDFSGKVRFNITWMI